MLRIFCHLKRGASRSDTMLSARQVATRLGCSYCTILRYADRLGLGKRIGSSGPMIALNDSEIARICREIEKLRAQRSPTDQRWLGATLKEEENLP